MNAREMEDAIMDFFLSAESTEEGDAFDVRTFEESGVMTRNRGLVIRVQDGSEFQVSIVQSKYPHEEDEEEMPAESISGDRAINEANKETTRDCTCGNNVVTWAEDDDAGIRGYWCTRCNRYRGVSGEEKGSKVTRESLTCSQLKTINERFKPGASILSKPARTSVEKGLKATGMTQEKIAQKMGVASSTLSRYKLRKGEGKRRPSFVTLGKLAKATGRAPEQLFPELT